MRRFILIPHLKIQNANALSSPFTIGFPAMTAWLGGTHALQRKLNQNGFADLIFSAVAISCHSIDLQTYKAKNGYDSSLILTRNPLDKDGGSPSIIEEARCHLDVSLLIEFKGADGEEIEQLKDKITNQLHKMKFAGGDILNFKKIENLNYDEDEDNSSQQLKKITNKLMLGNVIISRNELMKEAMENGQDVMDAMLDENIDYELRLQKQDAMDAMLDYLKIYSQAETNDKENSENSCEQNDKKPQDKKVEWQSYRKTSGWIVPIAVGFHGISEIAEIGTVKNQRDPETPHRFAESVVTLGQFIMPYRIKDIDEMLWKYEYQAENNLYLCKTLKTFNNLNNN
jgi:CRISPR-associated protein Csy2